jgi:hypothetical protein
MWEHKYQTSFILPLCLAAVVTFAYLQPARSQQPNNQNHSQSVQNAQRAFDGAMDEMNGKIERINRIPACEFNDCSAIDDLIAQVAPLADALGAAQDSNNALIENDNSYIANEEQHLRNMNDELRHQMDALVTMVFMKEIASSVATGATFYQSVLTEVADLATAYGDDVLFAADFEQAREIIVRTAGENAFLGIATGKAMDTAGSQAGGMAALGGDADTGAILGGKLADTLTGIVGAVDEASSRVGKIRDLFGVLGDARASGNVAAANNATSQIKGNIKGAGISAVLALANEAAGWAIVEQELRVNEMQATQSGATVRLNEYHQVQNGHERDGAAITAMQGQLAAKVSQLGEMRAIAASNARRQMNREIEVAQAELDAAFDAAQADDDVASGLQGQIDDMPDLGDLADAISAMDEVAQNNADSGHRFEERAQQAEANGDIEAAAELRRQAQDRYDTAAEIRDRAAALGDAALDQVERKRLLQEEIARREAEAAARRAQAQADYDQAFVDAYNRFYGRTDHRPARTAQIDNSGGQQGFITVDLFEPLAASAQSAQTAIAAVVVVSGAALDNAIQTRQGIGAAREQARPRPRYGRRGGVNADEVLDDLGHAVDDRIYDAEQTAPRPTMQDNTGSTGTRGNTATRPPTVSRPAVDSGMSEETPVTTGSADGAGSASQQDNSTPIAPNVVIEEVEESVHIEELTPRVETRPQHEEIVVPDDPRCSEVVTLPDPDQIGGNCAWIEQALGEITELQQTAAYCQVAQSETRKLDSVWSELFANYGLHDCGS